MILYIQTGLTPSTRHETWDCVRRQVWMVTSQTDMSDSSDNLVGFFSRAVFFFNRVSGRVTSFIFWMYMFTFTSDFSLKWD